MKIIASILLAATLTSLAELPSTVIRTNQQIATTITNGTAYTYAGTNYVDCSRYSRVGLEFSAGGTNASSGSHTLVFKRSMDGTNYETTAGIVWTITSSGTTPFRLMTNWDVGNYNYVKLFYITNSIDADLTNATLWGYTKGYLRE